MSVATIAFIRAFAALSRAQIQLTRATNGAIEALGGMAIHSLREAELDQLTAIIYKQGALHRGERIEEWEERWWSTALPKKPGRILVGGCGAGRELVWLLERGWDVEGFDPADSLVDIARKRVRESALARSPRTARVDVLGFAGFIEEVALGRRGGYDAVLLGWGSVSHCLSETTRRRLLDACADRCPSGPILLSWQGVDDIAGRQRRAAALGARVGHALGALRGFADADDDKPSWRDRVLLFPHAGATAFLDEREVQDLAASLGRDVVYDSEVMPHASLVKQRRGKRRRSARALDAHALELLADVLSLHGQQRLVAHGGSMKPAIAPGSTIEIHRVDRAEPLRLGDVVAARLGARLLVHRVVGLDTDGRCLLKGDACDAPDGWVEASAILGRVASVDGVCGPAPVPHTASGLHRALPRWRRAIARVVLAKRALARDRTH